MGEISKLALCSRVLFDKEMLDLRSMVHRLQQENSRLQQENTQMREQAEKGGEESPELQWWRESLHHWRDRANDICVPHQPYPEDFMAAQALRFRHSDDLFSDDHYFVSTSPVPEEILSFLKQFYMDLGNRIGEHLIDMIGAAAEEFSSTSERFWVEGQACYSASAMAAIMYADKKGDAVGATYHLASFDAPYVILFWSERRRRALTSDAVEVLERGGAAGEEVQEVRHKETGAEGEDETLET